MPLTAFQAAIAELLAVNRSSDSYLAGGAALHIEPNSKRYSNDLDYFHDSEERVALAVLVATGYRGGQNVYRYGVGVAPRTVSSELPAHK